MKYLELGLAVVFFALLAPNGRSATGTEADEIKKLQAEVLAQQKELEESNNLLAAANQALKDANKANADIIVLLETEKAKSEKRIQEISKRIDGIALKLKEILFAQTTEFIPLLGSRDGDKRQPTLVIPPHSHITKVLIVSGDWVNKVGFFYDGSKPQTPIGGNQAAVDETFDLNGKRLVGIEVEFVGGDSIRRIRFKAKDGAGITQWSKWYGKNSQDATRMVRESRPRSQEVDGGEIVGLVVEGKSVISKIGIVTRQIEYK